MDLVEILKRYFDCQKDFCVVGVSYNGLDALEKINRYRPDVVLFDIVMPIMDGLQLLEKVDLTLSVEKPVFITISAVESEKITKRALELGASLYFVKPFDIDLLISHIRQCLIQQPNN